jgi:hypothetical protein
MSLQFLLVAVVIGWIAGSFANYAADYLPLRCMGSNFGVMSPRSLLHNWTFFLLITRCATRKSYMAYVPYLSPGALFVMWWSW